MGMTSEDYDIKRIWAKILYKTQHTAIIKYANFENIFLIFWNIALISFSFRFKVMVKNTQHGAIITKLWVCNRFYRFCEFYRVAVLNLCGTWDWFHGRQFFRELESGRWSWLGLPLTSCCTSWFLPGHRPVSAHSPGVWDPCSRCIPKRNSCTCRTKDMAETGHRNTVCNSIQCKYL